MPWVKIDDHFDEHRKNVAVGATGMALALAGLCYCNRNLTDGFIPRSVARTLVDFEGLAFVGPMAEGGFGSGEDVQAGHVIQMLVDVGTWDEVPGGYQVRNYADYQPTRAAVVAEREQKKRAGHKGGLATAVARARANAQQPPQRKPSTRRSKKPAEAVAESKPVPVPGNHSSPKAAAVVTRAGERAAAASPSLVASGDRSAAEEQEPDPSTNGTRCRHGNDPSTCGICSPAVGVAPTTRLSETLRQPPPAESETP